MNNDFVEDAGEEIKINNKVIEDVDYYVYLGQRVTLKTSSKEDEKKDAFISDGRPSEEPVPFLKTNKFLSHSKDKFTTNVSHQQSHMVQKLGTLQNTWQEN